MSRFPSLTGKQLISMLKRSGFSEDRKRGSHVLLKHPDGRVTVVPIHAGETIGPGLLAKILRDVDMSREELHKLSSK